MTRFESADNYPSGGYPKLLLSEVFEEKGPIHGLSELQRRSVVPPTETIDAEIAVEIMSELGQLNIVED